MPAATETRSPIPSLVEWAAHSPQAKVTLTSHAFAHDGKVVLVDPIEGDAATEAAILKLGQPVLIVLTSGNHERAANLWRKKFSVPTAFSALASREISFKPDVVLETVKNIHGFQPVALPGGATGEHALFVPHLKLLVLGDALINLPETGLGRLPDKYASNPAALAKSLGTLAKLDFEHTAFAHGPTLVRDGKKRLIPLLESK